MADFFVEVTQRVKVTLDEAKFTPQFMEEFREGFFDYHTLGEHAKHIGRLYALGLIELGWERADFVEGYGPAHEMGIKAETYYEDSDVLAGM